MNECTENFNCLNYAHLSRLRKIILEVAKLFLETVAMVDSQTIVHKHSDLGELKTVLIL